MYKFPKSQALEASWSSAQLPPSIINAIPCINPAQSFAAPWGTGVLLEVVCGPKIAPGVGILQQQPLLVSSLCGCCGDGFF